LGKSPILVAAADELGISSMRRPKVQQYRLPDRTNGIRRLRIELGDP
jgi:hypothetical protein